jgi:hypothetical protein
MRQFGRGGILAIALLVAFNAVMIGLWLSGGASQDALVAMGLIPGNAMLCIIALSAIDRRQAPPRH